MTMILVADDEARIRKNICELLNLRGFGTLEAADGEMVLDAIASARPDAILLDLMMPGMDGIETLSRVRKIDPLIPVVMVTAHGDIPTAVRAVKEGAYDFIPKPPDFDHLILTIGRAIEAANLRRRVEELDGTLRSSMEETLGVSDAMRHNISRLTRIASRDVTILIEGETGTGKTFLARMIHSISRRASRPYVKISIGSLQNSIVESELFGHEKGAFTGADKATTGYFESAEKGTVFIDDMDNISLVTQGKLLSVIEDRRIFRLGSTTPIPLDVRFICATNADLLNLVAEGRFREDLYFRLSEMTLTLPPLRERPEDIAFFARKFYEDICAEIDVPFRELPAATIDLLTRHPWPGNLRQLRNVLRRAALVARDEAEFAAEAERLTTQPAIPGKGTNAETPGFTLRDAERTAIQRALSRTGGQKTKAAAILEIDYKTLARKMQEYGITT